MDQASGKVPAIVIVEDDPTDLDIFDRAAHRADPHVSVFSAATLDEASSLIHSCLSTHDVRLILLDFAVGGGNILDLLRELRAPGNVVPIPVVIVTGCANPDQIDLAERIGVNSVIHKPSDRDEFNGLAEDLVRYWITKNLVPAIEPI